MFYSTARMHNRKSRHQDRRTWVVERLESRCMLAGVVTGVVRGTSLTLTGDAAANDIVLTGNAGALQVNSGADSTTINITGDLARVRRVTIKTEAGADVVTADNLTLNGSLTITGTGSETITIDQSTVNGLLRVDLNQSGSRTLTISDSNLTRGALVTTDGGQLDATLSGSTTIRSRYSSNASGDDDFLMQDDATINGSLQRTTRSGDSSTHLEDQSKVTGIVRARTTDGVSDVQITDDAEIGRFIGSGVNSSRNVTFATRDGRALKADIYQPKTDGPHPAIITIHGGGWRVGSKAAMTRRARALADRGYVVVNVSYRLAPADRFPAQIHDIKSAITWTKANAATYDIDADQIATYGYSAGAHLALLAATTDGSEGLEGPDADGGISTRVQAVVAGGPGVDFRDFAANEDRLSYFFGGTISDLPEAYENASPAHWLSADDPPTMIFIGENESVVSRPKVDAYMAQLDSFGITNEFYEVPGKGHLPAATDAKALLESAKFFDEILKA
ncbi:MAG: alpha/beta hydrolase fold domain-containing protein [Planctomycetota bacterium]